MPTDRSELLDKLKRAPDRVQRLIEDHPDDLLCQAGDGGGWGAVEIMAFLRDWDVVVDDRLSLMLEVDDPEFEEEDPDLWSIERDYHAEKPDAVLAEFRAGREHLTERLQSLDDAAWARNGHMPDGTAVTVDGLVAGLVQNDQEYLGRLRDLLL
jgi:hypothetical protein